MLEFDINNDTSYYNQLINEMNTAVKYTVSKLGIHFDMALSSVFKYLIVDNNYCCFSRDYGMRQAMIQKYKRSDYFNLICSSLKIKNPQIFHSLVRENNGKYYCTEDNIKYLIDYYCNNELLPIINNWSIDLNLFREYKNNNVIQPQNISYFQPSDECRKSILDNTQTSLKNSSFVCSGLFAYSDVGKVRENQEDSYYVGVHPSNPNFKIMMVADGMGGVQNGEIASNIAVKDMMLWFDSLPDSEFYNQDNKNLGQELNKVAEQINEKINYQASGGGTTLCVSIIKNDAILMANIGDSQGYIIENNRLVTMTKPQNVPSYNGVPSQVARYSKDNNVITHCLGGGNNQSKMVISQYSKNLQYKII